jgi:hypothetical protein
MDGTGHGVFTVENNHLGAHHLAQRGFSGVEGVLDHLVEEIPLGEDAHQFLTPGHHHRADAPGDHLLGGHRHGHILIHGQPGAALHVAHRSLEDVLTDGPAITPLHPSQILI